MRSVLLTAIVEGNDDFEGGAVLEEFNHWRGGEWDQLVSLAHSGQKIR
jgi:hypothetical protein